MNLDKLQEYLGVHVDAEEARDTDAGPASVADLPGAAWKGPDTSKPGASRCSDAVAGIPGNTVVQPSVLERMQEIQLAQKLGYLICKCTWPPQVMTLSTSDFIYRCPRCSRVRDF